MPIVTDGVAADIDIAIIGAGAAGLAAAHHLGTDHPELSVLVLEAASHIGGRARTIVPEALGHPVDLGCGWLHAAHSNVWRHLAADYGCTVDRKPAPWNEGSVDLGLPAAEAADYEVALAAFYAAAESAAAAGQDGALGDLIAPGCRWRGLFDAVSTFVSGVELAHVSVRDHAGYHPGEGPDWRVVEGYGRLIAAFGAAAPVMLDTPVALIDHSAADRIRLTTPRGILAAKAVIVTVSTAILAGEGLRFSPALPDKLEAASRLPLGLADKIFLHVREEIDLPIEGYRLGMPLAGRTAAYHLRPFGRPVIEAFYGGALARDLEAEGEEAAVAFAIEELTAQFGTAIRRALAPLAVTAWGQQPFIRGSYAYAVPGSAGSRARLAEPIEDRLFFAGEACSEQAFTTAHGAYETGRASALAAAAALAGRGSGAVNDG